MRSYFLYTVVIVLLYTACNNTERNQAVDISAGTLVKRFGSVTGIKQDKISYYKQLHAAVWPGVLKKIKECNIQNYSIYLQKIDTGYYLFSYFEYAGADLEEDMKKMAMDSTTRRWWKETDPAQNPLPEARAKKKIWTNMEEVFHSD
jgi:L-rhamnose mutarotase